MTGLQDKLARHMRCVIYEMGKDGKYPIMPAMKIGKIETVVSELENGRCEK
jgi:hypothetical protein